MWSIKCSHTNGHTWWEKPAGGKQAQGTWSAYGGRKETPPTQGWVSSRLMSGSSRAKNEARPVGALIPKERCPERAHRSSEGCDEAEIKKNRVGPYSSEEDARQISSAQSVRVQTVGTNLFYFLFFNDGLHLILFCTAPWLDNHILYKASPLAFPPATVIITSLTILPLPYLTSPGLFWPICTS